MPGEPMPHRRRRRDVGHQGGAVAMTLSITPLLAGADASPGLAETYPGAVRTGCGGGQDDLVAVLEECALRAAHVNRLLPTPGQLDEGTALGLVQPGDGARCKEVARAGRCAVNGEVGEHLGGGPVHRGVRRATDDVAVPLDL